MPASRHSVSTPTFFRHALWPWLLIPVLSFLWFWIWRSGVWSGGDSEHWEREINLGTWWRRRQMLSFATMQSIYTLGRAWTGWSARYAINFVSCAAGALALLALWRLLRGQRQSALAFAMVASAGFTTIFYGHIETYAQPVAALLLHLLAVRRVGQRRWAPWTLVATFGLVMAFHLVILFALPALAAVLVCELRRRGLRRRDVATTALAALPSIVFWYCVAQRHWGEGELVGPHFIALLPDLIRKPWIVFTHARVPCKFEFMMWNGGAAALVALGVFARAAWRPRRDPFVVYLLLYFLCFIGFTAVWNPDAVERDFDLFCFPWVIACVAAAWRVDKLPWRPVLVGAILGVNAYLWITRTAVFADLPNRGTGTIVIEWEHPTDEIMLRIDKACKLGQMNRFVPVGTHEVTAKGQGKLWRQLIDLRPGETCRLRLGPEGLNYEPPGK